MRILIVLMIIFSHWPSFSSDDHDHNHDHSTENPTSTSEDFRILKKIRLSDARVWLIVREQGHLLGQPFHVELRVQCENLESESTTPMDLPIKDSFSVCDLDPSSVRVNSNNTALALKTKMADTNDYNKQVAAGVIDPKPKCDPATVIKMFSLRNLCSKP